MCGIAGTIGWADERVIKAMTEALAHRGPDDQGLYVDKAGRVALGHRRLSIIDLSAAGHQPMSYANGRYWITFNGEIYNFMELRAELERCGHQFRSATDTEVLLAAYAEWGEACLKRLRGMFAFAIYDRGPQMTDGSQPSAIRSRLFLARDRLGVKPLYYAQVNGVFLFASEIKALLASGLISRRVDHQAIWDYLSLGSVPQPRTILADAKALLPSHAMTVNSRGEVRAYRYWDIATNATRAFPQAHWMDGVEASRELRRLLEEATRLHLIADVPVGAFLSGGIDSTAVVGLMSQYVSRPIKTYTIGFESQHARLSELKWAKVAAERFGTEHTEVILTGTEVARNYDHLIQAIDQPSLDGTNTYFVSKATRSGVTVALSGLGGDELFAGYPQFQRFKQADQWEKAEWSAGQLLPRWLAPILPARLLPDKPFLTATPLVRHASIRCLADEVRKKQMTSPAFRAQCAMVPLMEVYAQRFRPELDAVAQVSYVELTGYMANTLLRDADAMSMAHALEVRPVLLDHVLAEYAFALSPDLKLNGSRTKVILLDALRDLLPEPIVQRPKQGFEMPLVEWLSGPLRERAQAALSSPSAVAIFSPRYVAEMKHALEQPQRQSAALWAYVLLIEWLQWYHCGV